MLLQRNVVLGAVGSYDEGDNTDDSLYGNEESITEWLNDHTAPGQNTASPGNGHIISAATTTASAGNAASDSLLTRRSSSSSNHTNTGENTLLQQALGEVDLEGNNQGSSSLGNGINGNIHVVNNSSASNPGSPHVVMKSGAVNNSTTVRKRSAIV